MAMPQMPGNVLPAKSSVSELRRKNIIGETTIMDFITSFLLSYRTEIVDELHYSHTYWIFLLPLVMIATDVVSGWIQATINSTWDSTKMRKGLFRKGGEMMVVVVAWLVGIAIPLDFNIAFFFSIYIVLMEAVSIIENLDLAGIPMPVWIIKRLKKTMQDMTDGTDK